MLERPLFPDFTEAASPESPTIEFLGLSTLPLPGILDRNPRKERVESLVSDLLNEGYDERASPEGEPFLDEAPPSLEDWLPIVNQVCEDRELAGRELCFSKTAKREWGKSGESWGC